LLKIHHHHKRTNIPPLSFQQQVDVNRKTIKKRKCLISPTKIINTLLLALMGDFAKRKEKNGNESAFSIFVVYEKKNVIINIFCEF
jgi:hypothetical protein